MLDLVQKPINSLFSFLNLYSDATPLMIHHSHLSNLCVIVHVTRLPPLLRFFLRRSYFGIDPFPQAQYKLVSFDWSTFKKFSSIFALQCVIDLCSPFTQSGMLISPLPPLFVFIYNRMAFCCIGYCLSDCNECRTSSHHQKWLVSPFSSNFDLTTLPLCQLHVFISFSVCFRNIY